MPANPVWVVEVILLNQGFVSPPDADRRRRHMPVGEERIPESQGVEYRSDGGRQHLADAQFQMGRTLENSNREPACPRGQGGCAASGSATDDGDIEGLAHVALGLGPKGTGGSRTTILVGWC